jgi:fibronectin-binding autotransporter adhesin
MAVAAALLIAASLAPPASAASTNWKGTTSNDWTVGSNWDNGVPTDTTPVTVNGPGVVLGVGGAATGSAYTVIVAAPVGKTATLTIQNGSTLTSAGSSRLANVAGSTGVVTVTGAGSQC